jgi:hypothetical protein
MSRETFWSRRRAQVESEDAAEAARRIEAEDAHKNAAVAEKSDEEILAEYNLPNPDEIKLGDDVTGFMQKAIPERLRRRALRKLWRTNPVLACVDGLNDYDGDFSNAATDAPGVKTAYQVGKGLLKHVEALAEQERAKTEIVIAELPAEVDHSGKSAVISENMQEDEDAAPASATKVVVAPVSIGEKSEPADETAVTPRRMRFSFETEIE